MPALEPPQTYALPHGRFYGQGKTTIRIITIIIMVYGVSLKYDIVCLEYVIFFRYLLAFQVYIVIRTARRTYLDMHLHI